MNDTGITVICDAGPLIHLDEVDCLSLLNDFDKVFVPVQVWDEVSYHRASAFNNPNIIFARVEVALSTEPSFQTLVSAFSLDLGEQAALTLMQNNPQAIFLTDDAAARLAAVTIGYQVHGTIGILIRAIRRQQRTSHEIVTILRELPRRSTLHIRLDLLQEIITRLENEA